MRIAIQMYKYLGVSRSASKARLPRILIIYQSYYCCLARSLNLRTRARILVRVAKRLEQKSQVPVQVINGARWRMPRRPVRLCEKRVSESRSYSVQFCTAKRAKFFLFLFFNMIAFLSLQLQSATHPNFFKDWRQKMLPLIIKEIATCFAPSLVSARIFSRIHSNEPYTIVRLQ